MVRKRRKKSKNYFTKETEDYIVKFNGLDPVESRFHLVISSLDMEVTVYLAVLGRGELPKVDIGTSALHDEMDRLALVADDEADVLGLDIELANSLLWHD